MKSFTWLSPAMFWLLLLVPAACGLYGWQMLRRLRDLEKFTDPGLFASLNPALAAGRLQLPLRLALFGAGLALIVLGLARPAGNPTVEEERLERKGMDIMLMVDLSSSMRAEDFPPNRLQAVKKAVKDFIDRLSVDRVGLTVFAGSVSLQAPLTLDYRTVKMMMDIVSTVFLPVDGTALGDAIQFTLDRIGKQSQADAVLILLTDGENTRGRDPLEAAKKAKAARTRIYTIGIGTPQGARIPDGADELGRPRFRMYQGEPVVTKLDEDTLKAIASETGGKYFSVSTSEALAQAYEEISRLTKSLHAETKKKYRYQEYFAWLAVPGLLCLLLETVLGLMFRLPKLRELLA